ncbi:hypothetical protein [Levilactobacillus brevis]|uniref:hypothetical protein n=1 Tax=Levilactobacillus brevis TaxID=1580 RepID=UPI0032619503
MNNKENDLQLALTAFAQSAVGIAIAQKKYFDACIDNGFTEKQALYLTYHYNNFLFNEGFYNDDYEQSESEDDY